MKQIGYITLANGERRTAIRTSNGYKPDHLVFVVTSKNDALFVFGTRRCTAEQRRTWVAEES